MTTALRRLAPALLLLLLAPITAEYLLADFSVRGLAFLPLYLPQYGAGALLIREVARRYRRGWPAIILLAIAYGLIEEGFTTQSLFNPAYLGRHLLDYGYTQWLGTSPFQALFVITIHVVWSVATPILIAEGVAGARRTTPWLGGLGLSIVGCVFVIGCLITVGITAVTSPFVASPAQFLAVTVLVVASISVAFLRVPRPLAAFGRWSEGPPAPWLICGATVLLAGAFEIIRHQAPAHGIPALVGTAGVVAVQALAIVILLTWSHRFDSRSYVAVAAGTTLTYAWLGLSTIAAGTTRLGQSTDMLDVAGQILEVMAVLAVIVWAYRNAHVSDVNTPRAETLSEDRPQHPAA